MDILKIDGYDVNITNPKKILWPELEIRKIDYISGLIRLAPYILPYSSNRLLTTIRYPDGVEGKFFYQKSTPRYAPSWVETHTWKDTPYMLCNSLPTLVWLGNQAALELHTSFNRHMDEEHPTHLVIDLDPSRGQAFEDVVEASLLIHETLLQLGVESWVKTSGATGLQIYLPIGEKYNYTTARKINEFFGKYFSQKYPRLFTVERIVHKRGKKLYFDYLQMWHGKTITAPYSPRATRLATVSTPVEWKELRKGITPEDFTLLNIMNRLKKKGDLFKEMIEESHIQNLDHILEHVKKSNV